MTLAVAQSTGNSDTNNRVSSFLMTMGGPVTTGHTMVVFSLVVGPGVQDNSVSCSDSSSNSYTKIGTYCDTSNATQVDIFVATAVTGGSFLDITVSWSGSYYPGMVGYEVSNTATVSVDTHSFGHGTAPNTSDDTYATATAAGTNELAISVITGDNTAGNDVGWTNDSAWALGANGFWALNSGNTYQGESQVFASSGTVNANWSASASGAGTDYICALILLSEPQNPVNTVAPTISGTLQVGDTLTCNEGTWSPTPSSYLYQWYRATSSGGAGATPISGATSKTYILQSADATDYISVAVTGEK